jgi:hypothetical protein
MKHKAKVGIILSIISCSFLFYAYSSGITGLTMKNENGGCTCHGAEPSTDVTVTIVGPDQLSVNETGTYTVTITGGPLVRGGVNIAASFGLLEPGDSLQKIGDELTHLSPKSPVDSAVTFQFEYTAPDTVGEQILYTNGNSVNFEQGAFGDEWNFAPNKIITVLSSHMAVKDNNELTSYSLKQNYPNPFNSVTNMQYAIGSLPDGKAGRQFVSLKIFDVLGNKVATLVNEEKEPGQYNVAFDAAGLSSGVYFYKLTSGNYTSTRKMILSK